MPRSSNLRASAKRIWTKHLGSCTETISDFDLV
ncbi:hypothetical protein C347_05466 [Cryptococcus neoformans AD2-60a]|nr:hypothetical protein C347_05466 [Cryptococcus neoformans var. grubii AD2-60a]